MTVRATICSLLAGSALLSGTALAQESDNSLKPQVSGSFVGVAGFVDDDSSTDRNHAFGADAEIRLFGSTVLDNGLVVGYGVQGTFDSDSEGRAWAGGRLSGNLIGGQRGAGDGSGEAFVEKAYVFGRTGFGEVRLGRDHGVADMFAIAAPNVFRTVGVNDWENDITGLIDIHTINDFSGYSTKATYLTPANIFGGVIGGFQFGISYTPDTDACGSDFCSRLQGGLPRTQDGVTLVTTGPNSPFAADAIQSNWEQILELALIYQHYVGDVEIGLGASYVTADEQSGLTTQLFNGTQLFDDYESYAVGVNLAYGGFTLGGSYRNSNGAYISSDDNYIAYDAGISYETGPWGFMFAYGNSDAGHDGTVDPTDTSLFRQTQAYQTGVTYMVGSGVTVGLAGQFVQAEKPATGGGDEEATAILFESAIEF